MLRLLLFAFLVLLVVPNTAYSQAVSDGDACSTAGAMQSNNDATGMSFLLCNGTNWLERFRLSATTSTVKEIGSTGSTVAFAVLNKSSAAGSGARIAFETGSTVNTGDIAMIVETGNNSYLSFSNRTTGTVSEKMRLSSQGYLGIGDIAPSAALDVVRDINYTGVMADVSDWRMKDDVRPLTNALPRILALQGVSFVMKDDAKKARELGLIAQDVENVYPELVHETPDGTKTLNYVGLIGPLVEAVKELDSANSSLRSENDELKQMIHRLSARLDVIEGTARPPLSPLNR
jgi:hypothetical protein